MGDKYVDGYAIRAYDTYQIQSFDKQHVNLKCIESSPIPNARRVPYFSCVMNNPKIGKNKSYIAKMTELNRIMNTKQDQIIRVTNSTFLDTKCGDGFHHNIDNYYGDYIRI